MLQLRLLGPFEIRRDGQRVGLPPSKRTRALLAYLAVTNCRHRRERLCELLWGVPDDPRGALRWSLSKLRPYVDEPGRPRIRADRDAVAFDGEGTDVDILAVRAQSAAGIERLPTMMLEELVSRFEGEFLEGLDLPEQHAFTAWRIAQRDEAMRMHVALRHALITRSGDAAEVALRHARILSTVDSLSESAHAPLCRLLRETGRYDEADRQFAASTRFLRDQGIELTGALEQSRTATVVRAAPLETAAASASERTLLESAANRLAVSRGPIAVRASLQSVSGPSGNVPLALTSFVGRESEVAAVAALIAANRFVTLTGPGGVGKTRLALRLARDRLADLTDGVWFVELASLTDSTLVPGSVASALHYVLPTDRDPVSGLCSILMRQQLLLVFDNCEHLLATVGEVATALLMSCPGVTLLATSRQPLGVTGEATFRVPPLSLPNAETAATLAVSEAANFEALTLFVDRARAVQPSFALSDENAPIVAEIGRRLDGIPLAIELAATRIKLLSLGDLRDRLDERFRILTGGPRDALPRLQTLRALIGWSYDLLDDRERRFFRGAGIFAGGFTLGAATAICGDADLDELDIFDLLASLVDKSLIVAAIGDDLTRYSLLESTRLYALEMLVDSGEHTRLESRHLAFFCEAAAAAERAIERSGNDALLVPLVSDLENVRAALRYAVAAGDFSTGGALAVGAVRLFRRLGLSAEGIWWLEAALKTVDPSNLRLQCRIWSGITYLVGNTGGARARDAAERSVALARAAGDRELLAWTLTHRAVADIDELRRADAQAALAEATELFGPNPQDHQRARIVAVRHHIARLVGDLRAALEIGEELLLLYCRLGHESGELATMTNQAEILHGLGETTAAIAVARQTLERTARTDRNMRAILQLNLSGYHAAIGDATAAQAAGKDAIDLLAGDYAGWVGWATAAAIGHLALAHALCGDLHRAARLLGYWNASSNDLVVSREFTERTTHELLSAMLSEHLSVDDMEALLRAGAALAPADAIVEALSP